MKKTEIIKVLLMAAFLLAPAPLLAQSSIELLSRVEVEVTKTNERGEKVTVTEPAAKVLPGETVIYTNSYRNTGKEKASDIVINNPVPEHMSYIAGSAFGDGAEILFSADGGASFEAEGKVLKTGEDGKPRLARPEEYTSIRWIVTRELEPGDGGKVGFRARLQ